jgi:hypothetical protein
MLQVEVELFRSIEWKFAQSNTRFTQEVRPDTVAIQDSNA